MSASVLDYVLGGYVLVLWEGKGMVTQRVRRAGIGLELSFALMDFVLFLNYVLAS